ncbi:conserved hypothetical protein [Desulfofarcimen acetoxidans DSM 771]|jgi:cell fate (sporulation/competence/biofilm development) regulator YlbF (YheA/YmcA/DUF963 family)|uniref:Uncharacterized protein n=1 Tax=Desulfofarcimen acetoxidans (strain ATCC 49208 / DSM 771 / KCTC 5769 / VKM B-1644 / 5575) TaxID=485916 RepID=C8VZ42_DESAS|nr:YlbF family regulator [Desulfofarcimen acetoxidans]ACV62952.1 conserved hypothetical protein [Desulfofarcimen acetoxidans DSM 771]
MSAILNKARELGREIAESVELSAMRNAQDNMMSDPLAQSIIQEFEEKQQVYHMLRSQGQQLTEEQKQEIEAFEEKMLSNDLIVQYFKTQQEFEKIIEAVNNIISEAITGESHGCECGTSSCCSSCGSGGHGHC